MEGWGGLKLSKVYKYESEGKFAIEIAYYDVTVEHISHNATEI